MRTSSNGIRRGNLGTHHPSKEQARSRTNKDGREYAKHHIPAMKNKLLGKRQDKGHRLDWTSQKAEVDLGRAFSRIPMDNRDNRWTLRITIWKPYERKRPRVRPARHWKDELDDYWKGTTWQRRAQDRHVKYDRRENLTWDHHHHFCPVVGRVCEMIRTTWNCENDLWFPVMRLTTAIVTDRWL